jgi:hypothetical protein
MSKTRVNADEVMRARERRLEIEQLPLESIEWVNDAGDVLAVDAKTLADWRFIGLGHYHFVELVLFGNFATAETHVTHYGRPTP